MMVGVDEMEQWQNVWKNTNTADKLERKVIGMFIKSVDAGQMGDRMPVTHVLQIRIALC